MEKPIRFLIRNLCILQSMPPVLIWRFMMLPVATMVGNSTRAMPHIKEAFMSIPCLMGGRRVLSVVADGILGCLTR